MAATLLCCTDHGQDFLRWIVDESGKVISCEPFQSAVWCGCQVTNLKGLKPGHTVQIARDGRVSEVKYPLEWVTPMTPAIAEVRWDSDGFITSTVRGKRASCTSNFRPAVQQLDCTPDRRLHSKWQLTPKREELR